MASTGQDQKESKKKEGISRVPAGQSMGRYVLTVIILVVVVVSFVVAPSIVGSFGGGSTLFARYKGQELRVPEDPFLPRVLTWYVQLYESQLQSQSDEPVQLSPSQIRQIWRQAYEESKLFIASVAEAQRNGIVFSDQQVDRKLAGFSEFREDGEFSFEVYNTTSVEQIRTLTLLAENLLMADRYYEDVTGIANRFSRMKEAQTFQQYLIYRQIYGPEQFVQQFGAQIPQRVISSAEEEYFAAMGAPRRQLGFVQFRYDAYPESEVVSYLQDHTQRFERIDLSSITVLSSEEDAIAARNRIVNREATFEEVAESVSTDTAAAQGGSLGETWFYELEREFEDAAVLETVYDLEAGEISDVLQTVNGWVIYRANEQAIEPDAADDEIIAEVRSYMQTSERGLIENFVEQQAAEYVVDARENGFLTAAVARDRTTSTTNYFPVNFERLPYLPSVTTEDGNAISNAAFRQPFFEAAFSLEEGEISEPVLLRDSVIVLRLEDERAMTEEERTSLLSRFDSVLVENAESSFASLALDEDAFVERFDAAYQELVRSSR